MATVGSTASSTSSNAAANIVSTLGAGSGIDIQSLAQKLVDAEQQPRAAAINDKITKTEARISGYGALKSALSDLKTAFATLDDASDFTSLTASVSQPAAFSAQTGPNAAAGSYDLEVTQVARAERDVATFASRSTRLNNGSAFQLTLAVGSGASAKTHTIDVTNATPGGIVSAINGAGIQGMSAQLVDTGSGVKVLITGAEGAANAFTVTSTATDVNFTEMQAARDANFTLNGVAITRPSNTVTDVLDGVTLKIANLTSGSARLDLTRDTSGITAKLKGLVTAYNDFHDSLGVLGDRASQVDTYGGSLAGDSLLRTVGDTVRRLITDPPKDFAGAAVQAPRDAGLSVDRYGKLTLDEGKLSSALQANFDQVVKMFSAGTDNKSMYSPAPAGAAGNAVRALDAMLRSGNVIEQQATSASRKITDYKDQLTKLQDRMTQLHDRYIQQFAAMDSLVGEATSTRTSLKSTFEAMLSSKN